MAAVIVGSAVAVLSPRAQVAIADLCYDGHGWRVACVYSSGGLLCDREGARTLFREDRARLEGPLRQVNKNLGRVRFDGPPVTRANSRLRSAEREKALQGGNRVAKSGTGSAPAHDRVERRTGVGVGVE